MELRQFTVEEAVAFACGDGTCSVPGDIAGVRNESQYLGGKVLVLWRESVIRTGGYV
ncbi:hypothetical protein HUB98_16390 [Paenibacillus barcinonensis]|uniref:Uncharacterized protein n=1 Tax=Paenibacillus barcinonensis TaxID=198119 RepID=A0ABX6Q6C3_PAEBA|nr:hypothetical protein [Paenibacillus barcinonensis]QKS57723.1 hypothetical protein HUB98_16390 [Paenibacillus barcinonensis]